MNKSDKETVEKVLLTGGLLYGAWLIIGKPLMGLLGTDPAVNSIDNTPAEQNPFSPEFQPFIDDVSQEGDLTQWMQQAKSFYDQSSPDAINSLIANGFGGGGGLDQPELAILAEKFKSAYSPWHIWGGDVAAVQEVFQAVHSQEDVAGIAAYLLVNYGIDLWDYLKTGGPWFLRGLVSSDLGAIVNHVNSLPERN